MIHLAEGVKWALGSNAGAIVAGNALSTGDYICLKNVQMAYCIVVHDGANDTDLTIGFNEATAVAGTSAAAITATFPHWTDANFGSASDTLVRGTDAATKAIDPATENPSFTIFQIDPRILSDGFDCIAVTGTNGNASNNVCVLWALVPRYPADQPPTVITD